MVTTGVKESSGNTMYAGALFNAKKSTNCPDAPKNPARQPNKTARLSKSSFHLLVYNATIAAGTMVKAHTIYPKF
jgi:hypothetical protein